MLFKRIKYYSFSDLVANVRFDWPFDANLFFSRNVVIYSKIQISSKQHSRSVRSAFDNLLSMLFYLLYFSSKYKQKDIQALPGSRRGDCPPPLPPKHFSYIFRYFMNENKKNITVTITAWKRNSFYPP